MSSATYFFPPISKNLFNIASEASYIWIGQKFIKNAKNCQYGKFFESLKLLKGQKLVENHSKCRIWILEF